MSSEGRRFQSWILRRDASASFSLEAMIEQFAREVLGKPSDLAAAYVVGNKAARWADVIRLQQDLVARNALPLLCKLDNQLCTASYLSENPVSSGLKRERAIRCGSRSSILRCIDTLDSRAYEALACVASVCAGAVKTHLTPPGNEGGIDFFALIRSPGRCHVFSENRSPIRVVGQCKKYTSAVGVDKIRQFAHSINSVYQQSQLIEKHVPSWFRDASGPVVGWVIGHSGFQSGANTVARNHGIILSDTVDLAEICAQSHHFPAPSSNVDFRVLLNEKVADQLKI